MENEIFGARAEQVSESCAQLTAPAEIPAHTHSCCHVVFQAQVSLVVAVLADSDAFETSSSALEMDFPTKSVFFRGASSHGGGLERLLFRMCVRSVTDRKARELSLGVIFVRIGWVFEEVGVREGGIWVDWVARCELPGRMREISGWKALLGCG